MYEALYRKWRPRTFDDVVGQELITTTLKNQVSAQKTGHAYLFTGSRGTGKTTCARILAKAVNCEHTDGGNPCLECDICNDAENFALSDIIEIDAASNTSVNDMRDLRDGAVYTPERCKFKVYIIDEVHMLSASAFNALLKIMEEPPDYVKFILATTEIHKVPETIVSRCQRYDFKRIPAEKISERLLMIAQSEGIKIDRDATELIAHISEGGMRDAISLLDQCSAFSGEITKQTVSETAGIADRTYIFDLIDAFFSKNTTKALEITDSLNSGSKDMQRLCVELVAQLRNIMLLKTSPNVTSVNCMPDEKQRLSELAQKVSLSEIISEMSALQECSDRMTKAIDRKTEFEMCVVQISRIKLSDASGLDNTEIYDKIKELEQSFSSQINNVYSRIDSMPKTIVQQVPTAETQKLSELPQPEKIIAPVRTQKKNPVLLDNWAFICDEIFKAYKAIGQCFMYSTAKVDDDTVYIIASPDAKENIEQLLGRDEKAKPDITSIIERNVGHKIRFVLQDASEIEPQISPIQSIINEFSGKVTFDNH
mgnify:FL=1